jgi:sphingomyelin phosphodiesterase acid-like 3
MRNVVAGLLLLLCVSSARGEQFLSVSDIHFDPFADPSLVAKLEAADVSQWDAILATSGQTSFSTYGIDINNALLQSAVAEMKARIPSPSFVLISGDFLAHKFQPTYQQYATDKSQAAYTAFVTKTIAYVSAAFRNAYPGVPVYPVLGNNDSDCGDYAIAPDSPFLADVRGIWSPLVRSRSFDRRFATGGYYHADVPALHNVRIIALNTNFFSTNYKNTCGKPGPDPGLQELTWLDAELQLAHREGKRVWLLFHIPPGLDVFDTEEWGGACPNVKPQSFWKDEYQQRYLTILAAHRKTIVGSFAGHTHQDEFRFAAGRFIHINPSVTPVFGNNPAFEVVTVTRRGDIVDYTAHNLPNVTLPWTREYSFREAYAKPSYDDATLRQLEAAIAADPGIRTKYFNYYSSGVAKDSAAALAEWRGYWCGLRTIPVPAFASCYCGGK